MELQNKLITSIRPKNLEEFQQIKPLCKTHLIEHRLDGFTNPTITEISYKKYDNAFLVTCRPSAHQALSIEDEYSRITQIKTGIINGAKFVDIELETDKSLRDELIQFATEKGVKTIISYHNFRETPKKKQLEAFS